MIKNSWKKWEQAIAIIIWLLSIFFVLSISIRVCKCIIIIIDVIVVVWKRAKHVTRLEFLIDLKDSNNNNRDEINQDENDNEDKWFTRQNIRLLIEPWHEELRLYQENVSMSTVFRPISVDLSANNSNDEQQQTAFPTPPIEHKDDDDEEIERELRNEQQQQPANKLQGIKKGDIFTMG